MDLLLRSDAQVMHRRAMGSFSQVRMKRSIAIDLAVIGSVSWTSNQLRKLGL